MTCVVLLILLTMLFHPGCLRLISSSNALGVTDKAGPRLDVGPTIHVPQISPGLRSKKDGQAPSTNTLMDLVRHSSRNILVDEATTDGNAFTDSGVYRDSKLVNTEETSEESKSVSLLRLNRSPLELNLGKRSAPFYFSRCCYVDVFCSRGCRQPWFKGRQRRRKRSSSRHESPLGAPSAYSSKLEAVENLPQILDALEYIGDARELSRL